MTMTKTKKMLTIQTQCDSLTARMVADLIFSTHEVALRVAADLIRCSVHIFPNNALLFHRETFYSTNEKAHEEQIWHDDFAQNSYVAS